LGNYLINLINQKKSDPLGRVFEKISLTLLRLNKRQGLPHRSSGACGWSVPDNNNSGKHSITWQHRSIKTAVWEVLLWSGVAEVLFDGAQPSWLQLAGILPAFL
jgi:hypothetical protein